MAAFINNVVLCSPLSHRHRLQQLNTPVFPPSALQLPFRNFHRPPPPPPPAAAFTSQADAHLQLPPTLTASDDDYQGWEEFSQKVSGEWDGFGADFTAEGTPVELPETVVPEAYREWDVKVFDWQTQCPTLAQPHHDFMYKTVKLLPTVGCEADAATTYSIEERRAMTARAFAYHEATGSYVALWLPMNDKDQLIELEHCLVDPDLDHQSRYRVRVIQVLEKVPTTLKLQSVRVFVEQWYGPFRNGDQLGGCAIRDSAFATTQPLKESQVSGVWQGQMTAANFSNSDPPQQHMIRVRQLKDRFTCNSTRDGNEDGVVLLPKQLWCSVKAADEGVETCCEAGWLLGPSHAINSKCTFSSTGELMEIAVATETAIAVQ